jgi:hypothetical protein
MGESLIGFFLTRSCRPSTNESEADDKIPTSKSPRAIPKEAAPTRGRSLRHVWVLRETTEWLRLLSQLTTSNSCALLTFAHHPKSN